MTSRGVEVRAEGTGPVEVPVDGAARPPRAGLSTSAAGIRRRACIQLASVAAAILAITAYVQLGAKPAARATASSLMVPASGPSVPSDAAVPTAELTESEAPTAPGAAPVATPSPPAPDRARIAAAEAALDTASGDRARADGRAADASRRMAQAASQAALDALRARKLAFQIRDPSNRIAQAAARGGFVRGERDKLAKEVATLRSAPRPKSVTILSKSPVARPVADDEYHFELRRGRITYIDLDKLMNLTKDDARMRDQMSDRVGTISNKFGPVGAFSLAYEISPTVPSDLQGLMERRSMRRYELQGWELVPESDLRGESYEATLNPISDFRRAVNRINPERATITLWVYPDSFGLYRRIRADLVDRGFSVAGRPLPAGLGIRGSPMGSQSAAQ
jgi:hypothetical protein